MVVDLKEFLSKAPRITVPTQYNTPVLNDVAQNLQFTYDLSKQGRRIQRAESSHTMVAAVKAQFTLPSVPLDEIHIYHFMAVHQVTAGGTVAWVLNVQYPQFADPQGEIYQLDMGTMLNWFASASGSTSRSQRGGTPLQVFPEGILSVGSQASHTIGDVIRFSILREVVGGAAVVEQVSSIVVDTEQ